MITRILIPLCWTLWGVLLVVLLYGLVKVSTERTSSPEAGRGLGIWAVTVYNDPEIVRALADHGANLDHMQSDGTPAVVGLIGTRQWESALYLIEKGANLDISNSHGLSVDYYLSEWKESVDGEHPAGWDKVREAIAKRRAARK